MTSIPSLKLLFLLPFPPDLKGTHGGSRATAAIVDMLSRQHEVHVLYLSDPAGAEPGELPGGCARMEAVPAGRVNRRRSLSARLAGVIGRLLWRAPQWVEESWSPAMGERAAELASKIKPDVAHYEFHVMAQYIPAVRAAFPAARAVVTEHEPGILADRSDGTPTLIKRIGGYARLRAWRRFERRVLPMADAIITFTRTDAIALEHLLRTNSSPITTIPLRLPVRQSTAPVTKKSIRSDFLFTGNFAHPPNVDAALRLVRDIFPLIQKALPKATLKIVGANPPEDLLSYASDTIDITGWVDDPSVYVRGASVVLVPLRQGGGLRVKMLEACSAGKAIVASHVAVEGLGLVDGQDFILADSDQEFANSAIVLSKDRKLRGRLEMASRIWSEQEQDEGRWSEQYYQFYARLFDRPARGQVEQRS